MIKLPQSDINFLVRLAALRHCSFHQVLFDTANELGYCDIPSFLSSGLCEHGFTDSIRSRLFDVFTAPLYAKERERVEREILKKADAIRARQGVLDL